MTVTWSKKNYKKILGSAPFDRVGRETGDINIFYLAIMLFLSQANKDILGLKFACSGMIMLILITRTTC